METYDAIIIGAGPAGMSAALFAKGDGLKFRLIEKGKPCAFVEEVVNTNFTNLENYLGLYNLNGTQVSKRFRDHLVDSGINIQRDSIESLIREGVLLRVVSRNEEYKTRTVILATGTRPKKLEINGSERVNGRVHYAVIDKQVEQYVGKDIIVIGGRNSGAVTAVKLKELGCSPIVLEKSNISTAKEKYLKKIDELRIPYFLDSVLEEITGDGEIKCAYVNLGGVNQTLHPVAIYGCIGSEPNNELALSLGLKLDNSGYVLVDRQMRTSDERIFAAGDLNGGVKMIAVAVGEGAIAEYYANSFVKSAAKSK